MTAQVVPFKRATPDERPPRRLYDIINTIIVVDEAGDILDINQYNLVHKHPSRISKDQYLGKNVLSLPGINEVPRLKAKLEALLNGSSFSGLEITGAAKSASQKFWVRCFGAHCKEYSIVGFEDITEQKLLESESFAAIQKFQSLFDSHPDAVFCFDSNGYILNVNESSCNISGYTRGEMVGRNYKRLFHPNSYSTIIEGTRKLFRGQATTFEADFILKNGTSCRLAMTFIPISGKGHHIDGYYGIARDVTDKKKLEANRAKLIEELKQSHKAIARRSKLQELVLRMLGHDFRSPFNSILGGAKLLMELGLTDDQREMVEIIHRSAQHELKLIDNLLKFSQIEEGSIRFNLEPISSHVIVHEIRKQFLENAKQKHIKIVFGTVEAIHLIVDPDVFLRNVVCNVVHNALKYSYPGQEVRIEICKMDQSNGVIRIIDSGVGIPEEIMDHIFEINPAKKRMGTLKEKSTGFGLYISSHMTRLMKGDIKVESKPKKGTTISIIVPMSPEQRLITSNQKPMPPKSCDELEVEVRE